MIRQVPFIMWCRGNGTVAGRCKKHQYFASNALLFSEIAFDGSQYIRVVVHGKHNWSRHGRWVL
jgi:hypothetical protein